MCSCWGPPWNEGEKNIARVLEQALPRHGWEPSVCWNERTDPGAPPRHSLSAGKLGTALRFWAATGRAARRRGASVVHMITSASSALALKTQVVKRLSGAKLVLHVTGLAQPLRGYRLLDCADRVIVGGSYLAPLYDRPLELAPLTPHLNPELERDARGTAPAVPEGRVLFLGSMEPVRGVDVLIEAMAAMRNRSARLTIAWNGFGSSSYRDELRAHIDRLGLTSRVHWLGALDDLGPLYRAHDVVVIPRSAPERMGFPLRLIEAFSYGRPVVVSDIGEMRRASEGCGLVVAPRDPAALASALDEVLADPSRFASFSRAAYERARPYAPELLVERVVDVYDQVIDARRERKSALAAVVP